MHFSRTPEGMIWTRFSSEELEVIVKVFDALRNTVDAVDPLLFAPTPGELAALQGIFQTAVPREKMFLSPTQYLFLLDAISSAEDIFDEGFNEKLPISIWDVREDLERFRRRPRAVLARGDAGARHPFHDELFLDGEDIELVSVYLERDSKTRGKPDSTSQFSPDGYLYVVFLYFRDARGNPGRIRCWCEFTTAETIVGVAELDGQALNATIDLLHDAMVPAFERLELLWNHGLDAVNELHGWDEMAAWKASKKLAFGEFRFSCGYGNPKGQQESNGKVVAWQPLTGVFYRGPSEIWATAAAALTFSPETAPCERDFATYERSKQLFSYAAGLSPEHLLAKVSSEPVGSTDTAFELWD